MTTTTAVKINDESKAEMCPICMDDLPLLGAINRVSTECGHTFHTSCLMASVAHGKFSCPCCRAEMAEEPEEDDDSDDSDDSDEDEDEDEEYYPPVYDMERRRREIGFQGMRLMFQRENGEELEEKDEDEIEDEMEAFALAEIAAGRSGEPEDVPIVKPSIEYLTTALRRQGVTMQYMVKIMLMEHEEYEEDDDEFMEASDDIFGKLRILISNYQPPAAAAPAVNASAPFVPAPVDRPVTSLTGLMTAEEILSSEPESLEDLVHRALFHRIDKLIKMEKNERALMEQEDKPIV